MLMVRASTTFMCINVRRNLLGSAHQKRSNPIVETELHHRLTHSTRFSGALAGMRPVLGVQFRHGCRHVGNNDVIC